MSIYEEALRHLLAADRLMDTAGETLVRAELALPIELLTLRRDDGSSVDQPGATAQQAN